MNDIIVDLHNHSYYSDGVLSPNELVYLAKKQNCNIFALTDHDTTDGVMQAQKAAKKVGIEFINGVEISATWNNMTIHILGLGIDIDNKILQTGLKKHQDLRKIRQEKIAKSLSAAGIIKAMEKTKKIAKTDMITRTHFAQMLISEGVCKDMKSVFKRFLTGKKPGGVKGVWTDFDEVINWIHLAGGKAVLAHPFRYRMTRTKIKRMMSNLVQYGCDGVESICAYSSIDEIENMNKWANEFGLLLSVGSDYHGWDNQNIQIGKLQKLKNIEKALWRNW